LQFYFIYLFIYLFIPSFIEASHSLPVGGGNAP